MKSSAPQKTMSVTDAKAHFLELIRNVEKGKTIEITKDGKTVARIVPTEDAPLFGFATNVEILADLTQPLPLGWDEAEIQVHK